MRHALITNLEKAGVRPKVAQTLARHSDIRLTMNVYTHAELADQTAAIEAMAGPPSGTAENRPGGIWVGWIAKRRYQSPHFDHRGQYLVNARLHGRHLRPTMVGMSDVTRILLQIESGDNQALRREVERLLNHEGDVGSFLESPPPGVVSSADATADYCTVPALGSQIGPYKLLQQLGEGGMGIVYLAERQHPVKQRVALKLIKHGMDSRRFVARFEAERQALAMMDHPREENGA